MARPPTIRDETIIAAARAVFLERGAQATTAEVAVRAGVSEGSIFKRFRSKADLFEAAMGDLEDPPLLGHIEQAAGQGVVQENLRRLGLELVGYLRVAVPLSMMHWSNPRTEGQPRFLCGSSPTPLKLLHAFTRYFEREMALGRVRRHPPEIVARAFLGAVHNFVVFDILYGALHPSSRAEDFVDALLSVAAGGLWPAPPPVRGEETHVARRTSRGRDEPPPLRPPRATRPSSR